MNNDRLFDTDFDLEFDSTETDETSTKLLSDLDEYFEKSTPSVKDSNSNHYTEVALPELVYFEPEAATTSSADNTHGSESKDTDEKDGEPGKDTQRAGEDVQKPAAAATTDTASKITLKFGTVELKLDLPVGGEYIVERGKNGFDNSGLSRRHARISRDDKGFYVQDLDSTNGTWITSERGGTERRLKPNEKVYLSDLASLRFSNGPRMEGGKATAEAIRVAGHQVPNPDKFQRDLSNGEIVGEPESRRGGNSGHEKYTAKVKAEDGTIYDVYLRHMNNNQAVTRLRKELAAYELNRMLGFDNGFPPTSVRRFEVAKEQKFGAVQIAAGEDFQLSIESMLGSRKTDISGLLQNDPKLRREVEQAFLERLIYGDHDAHAENFRLVQRQGGGFSVVSIDLDHAFARNDAPIMVTASNQGVNEELFKYFSNAPISKEFKQKLDAFAKQFDTQEGREQLKALGLKAPEVEALLSRVRWFAEKGKFPEAVTFDEGAKLRTASEGPADPALRRQYDLEKIRIGMGLTALTRTGENGAAMVAKIGMFSDEVLKSSGLWEELQKQGPTVEKIKDAFAKAEALHHRTDKPAAPIAEASVKDYEKQAVDPAQRAARVAAILEKGVVRDLLKASGYAPDEARRLEKDLLSDDKEVKEKAMRAVERGYTGGYKAFLTEAKGRLSATAVVASAVLPLIQELEGGK